MAFPYSVHKTYVSGEILTASDLNSTDVNHINNNIPESMDDYSVNAAEMQSIADPYPASSESLATTLAGELERLRYQIKAITGETHWYYDVDTNLATLFQSIGTAQILGPSIGSELAPGYSFLGYPTMGMYGIGTNSIGFSTVGTGRWRISNTGELIPLGNGSNIIYLYDGTAATPILAFNNDTDTGLYRSAENTIAFAAGGNLSLTVGTDYIYPRKQFTATSGSAAAPSISFAAAPSSGLYHSSGNAFKLAVGGTDKVFYGSDIIHSAATYFPDGSAAAPSISFNNDIDSGIYRAATNSWRLAAGGQQVLAITSSDIISYKTHYFQSGSAAIPGIVFNDDTGFNTGIYRPGEDQLAITCGNNKVFHATGTDISVAFSGAPSVQFDDSTTANHTRLLVYDVNDSTLRRVEVGSDNSGGAGWKILRIAN